jgi:hypothetical protein
MSEIRIAFWNLGNLFDTTASEIATDFEFTPAHGWDKPTFEAKVRNLASIITQMHDGGGPDLLGVCEIENAAVAQRLMEATGRPDYRLAHVESPDLRGIDTSLIYSNQVFKPVEPEDIKSHMVHLRYPTRDIFEVHLRLIANDAELIVLVNHWPSRRQGQYETEPHRMTVAEHCGRLVDGFLTLSRAEFLALPNTPPSLAVLNERWNRNVLLMGDLNDEPFDRSVLNYLQGTKDLDHLEEEIKAASGQHLPEASSYLDRRAYLFNCAWPWLGAADKGTIHYPSGTNTMNVFDQFLVSRGLYYGKRDLRIRCEAAKIFTPPDLATPKGRPRPFDRKTKKGYSDHFPITGLIETV